MNIDIGTIINNRYRIDGILGQGGCGTTYYAFDNIQNVYVALKHIPSPMTNTDADNIQVLINAGEINGIASIYECFPYMDTTFIVMEYIEGMNAASYFEMYGADLDEAQILALMKPVINGICRLNSLGINHGDISTDNIVVSVDGYGVLTDLPTGTPASHVKHGFSPIELYYDSPLTTPATDVYGICATLYHMFTHTVPTDSYQISNGAVLTDIRQLCSTVSDNTASAIMYGLSYDSSSRCPSANELYALLYTDTYGAEVHETILQAAAKEPYIAAPSMKTYDPNTEKKAGNGKKASGDTTQQKKIKKKRILTAIGIIAALLVVLGASITVYVVSNKAQDDKDSQSEENERQSEEMEAAEEEYRQNLEKYSDAVEKINNAEDWDSVDEAVETLMELGDFEDSKQVLFDTAHTFLVDYGDYERALNIYEYLGTDTDSDGISGNEWCTECNFQNALSLYYNDDYSAAKDILEELDPYTSILNSSDNSTDILDECKYQLALSDMENNVTSRFEDAEDIFWDREDYYSLEQLASCYYNNGDYDKAEELYIALNDKTGYSYETEIHECQNASNLADKYVSYNAEESTIYDTSSGTINSYVDQNTAEYYMEDMYGTFTAQDGSSIEITKIEINGRKYCVKQIAIDGRDNLNVQITFYYSDEPDTEHTMIYKTNVEYTVFYDDGNSYTSEHNEIYIDGIAYAYYWD